MKLNGSVCAVCGEIGHVGPVCHRITKARRILFSRIFHISGKVNEKDAVPGWTLGDCENLWNKVNGLCTTANELQKSQDEAIGIMTEVTNAMLNIPKSKAKAK